MGCIRPSKLLDGRNFHLRMTVQMIAAAPTEAPMATRMMIVFFVMVLLLLGESSLDGAVCDGVDEDVDVVVVTSVDELVEVGEEELVGVVEGVEEVDAVLEVDVELVEVFVAEAVELRDLLVPGVSSGDVTDFVGDAGLPKIPFTMELSGLPC